MPGLDRSGPMGAGPMTGGRRGLCNRAGLADAPPANRSYGYGMGLGMRRGFRGGFGAGRGGGRGFGRGFGWNPPPFATGYPVSKADEMNMLKADAENLKRSLEAINRRIEELDDEKSE